MPKNIFKCTAMILALIASTAMAQSDPAETDRTTQDIEQLVETLEDPDARARLIGDLELLLEAGRQAGTPEQEQQSREVGVLELAENLVTGFWDRITSIDPKAVAVSTTISVGILIAALILRWVLLVLLRRFYFRLARGAPEDESNGERRDSGEHEEDDRLELPTAVARLVNLIVGVLAIALIAESWGAGFGELLRTDLGARIAETAVSVGLILIVTVALWNASELLVERLLKLGSRKLDRDRTVRRLDTLVPLLTSVLQTTITVLSALLILSELGVNIGPLLAGAGILGLAVGFGAQTLVKDLITGVTILLEDGATVGDVVEVAGHAGVVEEMRIRIMRLRDLSGVVHLVPYSEVTTIMNFTKDFSYYLFEVGIAYREDTDQVCDLLMEVSEDLCNDEEYSNDILEPLQILGVDQFADSAVVIKARIKTVPGKQWFVGRQFNRRMKKRFDEEGIEIPFPHTTVYFGEPKEGKAPPMQLALADSQGLERLAAEQDD